MTNEPSPRPWRMEEYGGDQPCCLVDANGRAVGVQYGDADAALIVDTVNERDRLRDIVRRIETEIERCHRRDGGISQELLDSVYEASAALGEGENLYGKGVGR